MDKLLEELKKLKNVYNEVKEFEIGKQLKVKLKTLTSEEETEVAAYASTYEQSLAYVYSIKRETLCKAIVGLNGKDIPDIIEQEKNKIQKHIWLRENVINGWSQMLVDQVWSKYAEIIAIVDKNIGKDIVEEDTKETK